MDASMDKTEKKPETHTEKEERRGRPNGREREEGDIDRAGHKGGIGGERAGGGRPVPMIVPEKKD